MDNYIGKVIIIIGLLGSLASILGQNKVIIYIFLVVTACGIILISIRYLKNQRKGTDLLFGRHPGLFAAQDLMKKEENNCILLSRLIKNIKYSDNNKTSNITYIMDGEITNNFCTGLFLTISAASLTSNIKKIGYSLILDSKEMIIHDDFHFIEGSNINQLLTFDANYKEIQMTPYAKKLFLPFPATCLQKGDKFQAVFYYTWENSIIDLTDSTSYHTSNLFPDGVKKLITNLVFTTKPIEVVVYRVTKTRKQIISKVQNIKKVNNLYVIRWEVDNPEGTYIIQRTLEKWS